MSGHNRNKKDEKRKYCNHNDTKTALEMAMRLPHGAVNMILMVVVAAARPKIVVVVAAVAGQW